MYQFRLQRLLACFVGAGVALVPLVSPTGLGSILVSLATFVLLIYAVIRVAVLGRRTPFWIGFAIAGWAGVFGGMWGMLESQEPFQQMFFTGVASFASGATGSDPESQMRLGAASNVVANYCVLAAASVGGLTACVIAARNPSVDSAKP